MLEDFSLGFIIILIYVAGFVLGWKAGSSFERREEN